MTSRRTRLASTAAALGAVLLLGATGCTSDNSDPAPTPTATSAADPTADAVATAKNVLQEYLDVQGQLTANPTAPPVDPSTVATDQALVGLNNLVNLYQTNGWTGVGSLTFDDIETFSVDLSGSPDASPPILPNVVFNTCIDASNSDAVDSSGVSVVPPDRLVLVKAQITVTNVGERWLVSNDLSPGEACDSE